MEGLNNKHTAVIAAGILILVFLVIAIWYMATHPATVVVPGNTATTTPVAGIAPKTLHIIDTGAHYDIDTAYPDSTTLRDSSGSAADAAAVLAMKGFEQNTINAFKESNGLTKMTDADFAKVSFGRDAKYALTIEYTTYGGPKTISYVYTIYEDTLGAHPNTYYRTFTFDRSTGEALDLSDLFTPSASYLERLSARTRADLPAIMAKMAQITPAEVDHDYIKTGTLAEADAFQNFDIDGTTLNIIFPPYQVGPYVYGAITDPIPLTAFKDILNPKYKP